MACGALIRRTLGVCPVLSPVSLRCVGEASGCPNVLRRADCLAIAEVPAGTRETRRVGRMGALGVYAVLRVYSMGLASSGQRALGEMCHVPVSGFCLPGARLEMAI